MSNPYDFNPPDDVCYVCGASLDEHAMTQPGTFEYDGYCSAECAEQQEPLSRRDVLVMLARDLGYDVTTLDRALVVLRSYAYDETECGASLSIDADTLIVSTIVEGTDFVPQSTILDTTRPISSRVFNNALSEIDAEAQHIWNMTHGCEHCFNGEPVFNEFIITVARPDDFGLRPVDPDCTHCHGKGIVI